MRVAALVVFAIALVACGDDDAAPSTTSTAIESSTSTAPAASTSTSPSSSTSTSSTATPTTTPATPLTAPSADAVVPRGFEQVAATVTAADGTVCELCLWLAATDDQRALGLMHVTDLGGPDGMVFRYDSPTTAAFWMKNTLMPLSIAFFGEDGAFIDAFDMAPCTVDPCPSYPTPANFVDAIEVPQGSLDQLAIAPGSVLTVSDVPCQSPGA